MVFSYIDEDIEMYATLESVEITKALVKGKSYFIRHDIDRLKYLIANIQQFRLNNQLAKWTDCIK